MRRGALAAELLLGATHGYACKHKQRRIANLNLGTRNSTTNNDDNNNNNNPDSD
jgi:hypothetical protein